MISHMKRVPCACGRNEKLVGQEGVEPSLSAYKAPVLPLNYKPMEREPRLELGIFGLQPNALPLGHTRKL